MGGAHGSRNELITVSEWLTRSDRPFSSTNISIFCARIRFPVTAKKIKSLQKRCKWCTSWNSYFGAGVPDASHDMVTGLPTTAST